MIPSTNNNTTFYKRKDKRSNIIKKKIINLILFHVSGISNKVTFF